MDELDIARELATAGAPIFTAPPCLPDCDRRDHDPGEGHNRTGFHFPLGWQRTRADPKAVDEWREGHALAMVCGHLFDALDKDTQNGGDLGWIGLTNHLKLLGMPRVFGVQRTPSGGEHLLISALGIAKSNEGIPARGVDLQAEGSFIFLAPTVKRSKLTGEPRPYTWLEQPRIDEALEWHGVDESGQHLADLVRTMRKYKDRDAGETRESAADAFSQDPERRRTGEWTEKQARDVVTASLLDLRNTRQGMGFNAALNNSAMLMGHFIPEFWDEAKARRMLERAVTTSVNAWPEVSRQDEATITSGLRAGMKEPYRRTEAVTEAVAEAIEATKDEPAETLASQLLGLDALLERPGADPLIKGVLDLDSECWIIGKPGGFKSFVALDWACHVALGKEWRGRRVTQGPVLYIAAEGDRGVGKRVKAWIEHHGARPELLHVLPVAVPVIDAKRWRELVALASEVKPVLIVVDTQARVTAGLDENAAKEMGLYVAGVTALRKATGACVLSVHHIGRNGMDGRGSSVIDAAQDWEWRVDRPGGGGRLLARLSCDKSKDGDGSQKFEFEMRVIDVGRDEDGEMVTSLVLGDETVIRDVRSKALQEITEAAQSLTTRAWVLGYMALVGDNSQGIARGLLKTELRKGLRELMTRAGAADIPKDTSFHKIFARLLGDGVLTDFDPETEARSTARLWLTDTGVAEAPDLTRFANDDRDVLIDS